MTCRTCKHLIVPPNSQGKRVPRKGNAYACGYVIERPLMPESVTTSYDFRWPPTHGRYMEPDGGKICPCYEKKD